MLAFPLEANAVDFVTIFCRPNRAATKRWRTIIRTKYIRLLLRIIDSIVALEDSPDRIATRDGQQATWDTWKIHMRTPEMEPFLAGKFEKLSRIRVTMPLHFVASSSGPVWQAVR